MSFRISKLAQFLMSGGGGSSLLTNPKVVLLGDSQTQYECRTVGLISVTLTRDTNGLVTFPCTGHGMYQNQPICMINANDSSYEGAWPGKYYLDANNYSYQTTVTGSPGTTTTTAAGILSQQNYHSTGYFWRVKGLLGGAVEFAGDYAQGGDTALTMTAQVADASARSGAQVAILMAGTNDATGGISGATIATRVQALSDAWLAGGTGRKIIILNIPPRGAAGNTAPIRASVEGANSALATYCAADTANRAFVNAYSLQADSGTANFDAYSYITIGTGGDTLHLSERGYSTYISGIQTALSTWSTLTGIAPTSSVDTPKVNNYQIVKQMSRWDGTTGGTLLNGATGAISSGWSINSTAATAGNCVCSVATNPNGLGDEITVTITPTGSGVVIVNPAGTSPTYASLNLAAGDLARFGLEMSITGVQACATYTGTMLKMHDSADQDKTQNGSTFAFTAGSTAHTDTAMGVYETESLLMPSATDASIAGVTSTMPTNTQARLILNFSGANANPVVLKMRRSFIRKYSP